MLNIDNYTRLFPVVQSAERARTCKITGFFIIVGSLGAASLLLPNAGYAIGTVAVGGIIGLALLKVRNSPPQEITDYNCSLCKRSVQEYPRIATLVATPLVNKVYEFLEHEDHFNLTIVSRGFHKFVHQKLLVKLNRIERNLFNLQDYLENKIRLLSLNPADQRALSCSPPLFQKACILIKIFKRMMVALETGHLYQYAIEAIHQRLEKIRTHINQCTAIEERLDSTKPQENPSIDYFDAIWRMLQSLHEKEVNCIIYTATVNNDLPMIQTLIHHSGTPRETLLLFLSCIQKNRYEACEVATEFLLRAYPINLSIASNPIDNAIRYGNTHSLRALIPATEPQRPRNQVKYELIKQAIRKKSIVSTRFLLRLPEILSAQQKTSLIEEARRNGRADTIEEVNFYCAD